MKATIRLLYFALFAWLFLSTASAYYDPRLGRWLSRDPIGEEGGVNLYAYCGNDPINRHDPTGLSTMDFRSLPYLDPSVRVALDQVDRERGVRVAEMVTDPRAIGSAKMLVGVLGMGASGFGEYVSIGSASPLALPAFAGSAALWASGLRQVTTGDSVNLSGQLVTMGVEPTAAVQTDLMLQGAMLFSTGPGFAVAGPSRAVSVDGKLGSIIDMVPDAAGTLVPAFRTSTLASIGADSRLLLAPGNPTTRTLAQVRALRGQTRWRAGEQYVQELYGSPGQQHFPVPTTGGRFVDAPVPLEGGVLANEVKTYQTWRTIGGVPRQQVVPLSASIRQQILRDVYLRRKIPGYDPRWMFIDAPPGSDLADFLTDRGIPFLIYH